MKRCDWSEVNQLYIDYHDTEWGVPVYDDKVQFEFLVLESAQAGLSWNTILNKRENYRKAYSNFDVEKVSKYDETKINELMNNKGIVRNRKKIEASINNANLFIELQKEFGSFSKFIWSYTQYKPIVNSFEKTEDIPAKTKLSERISKDLKKRGFKFFGPTICYAHMQATGIVNDHITSCFRYLEVQKIK
ncbi:DNA-3-methyladenine glycosylase I [Helicovermis profundi]|uniref:DNA-3-methyladenine glycosylase I n=1 Tax=Helicovermis profundi TaxID=3065157 RepID=A0AAU9EGA9_9FIRM|nr:DNA-3-methyladenine glycosylase I [Clostridia bacterium S502]